MLRAGVDFDMKNRVSVDVQTVFIKWKANFKALSFIAEKPENAHSAEADTIATYEILKAQLDRYPELENDMKSLSEFTERKLLILQE
jgi:DNA polymerase-3 subunit epsilon